MLSILRPEKSSKVVVSKSEEEIVQFNFEQSEATFARESDDLLISFEDGSEVRISDFFVANLENTLPKLELEDGTQISAEDFLHALDPNLDITPAAGPDSSSASNGASGIGEYLDDAGSLVSGVDRLGFQESVQWKEVADLFKILNHNIDTFGATGEVVPDPIQPEVPHARVVITNDLSDAPFQFLAQDSSGQVITDKDILNTVSIAPESTDLYTASFDALTGMITINLTELGKELLMEDEDFFDVITIKVGDSEYQVDLYGQGSSDSYDFATREDETKDDFSGQLLGEWYNSDGKTVSGESITLGGVGYNEAHINNENVEQSNALENSDITIADGYNGKVSINATSTGSNSIATGLYTEDGKSSTILAGVDDKTASEININASSEGAAFGVLSKGDTKLEADNISIKFNGNNTDSSNSAGVYSQTGITNIKAGENISISGVIDESQSTASDGGVSAVTAAAGASNTIQANGHFDVNIVSNTATANAGNAPTNAGNAPVDNVSSGAFGVQAFGDDSTNIISADSFDIDVAGNAQNAYGILSTGDGASSSISAQDGKGSIAVSSKGGGAVGLYTASGASTTINSNDNLDISVSGNQDTYGLYSNLGNTLVNNVSKFTESFELGPETSTSLSVTSSNGDSHALYATGDENNFGSNSISGNSINISSDATNDAYGLTATDSSMNFVGSDKAVDLSVSSENGSSYAMHASDGAQNIISSSFNPYVYPDGEYTFTVKLTAEAGAFGDAIALWADKGGVNSIFAANEQGLDLTIHGDIVSSNGGVNELRGSLDTQNTFRLDGSIISDASNSGLIVVGGDKHDTLILMANSVEEFQTRYGTWLESCTKNLSLASVEEITVSIDGVMSASDIEGLNTFLHGALLGGFFASDIAEINYEVNLGNGEYATMTYDEAREHYAAADNNVGETQVDAAFSDAYESTSHADINSQGAHYAQEESPYANEDSLNDSIARYSALPCVDNFFAASNASNDTLQMDDFAQNDYEVSSNVGGLYFDQADLIINGQAMDVEMIAPLRDTEDNYLSVELPFMALGIEKVSLESILNNTGGGIIELHAGFNNNPPIHDESSLEATLKDASPSSDSLITVSSDNLVADANIDASNAQAMAILQNMLQNAS